MSYADFIATKQRKHGDHGRDCSPSSVNPILHDWQREIVAWAVRKGRAAVWADTGLGKTFMQIEWARLLTDPSGYDRALIVAPLAVCQQSIREAAKLGISVRYLREDDGDGGLIVTNYEMADRFVAETFDAVVLDEASILKQSDGKTRTKLIQHFAPVRARLACTATPAPNDPEELTNQAEFLGVMPRVEMLAAYFIHDDQGWRLKGHARTPMFRWMTSWAVALRRPSDLGYSDEGYILPKLSIISQRVAMTTPPPDGGLMWGTIGGVGGRAKMRKETIGARVARAVELVNASHAIYSHGDKLTECHGSPSIKPTEKPEWRPTPNIESGSRINGSADSGHQRRTASTCGSTTALIPKDSSDLLNSRPPSMPADAQGTHPMPITGSESSRRTEELTQSESVTISCGGSTASGPPSLTPWWSGREEGVLSAAPSSETAPDVGWPSITATTLAESGESSALAATEGSATSETITRSSSAQPTISPEPWIIWCGLNAEQEALATALGDRAFSITGSMSPEEKVRMLYAWIDGERPVMISKTSILGMGINMQHCANMAFVGLGDSFEQYYQAIRRCWRYGQTRPVNAHIVLSDAEGEVAENVARKQDQASRMVDSLVAAMRSEWSSER